MHTQRSYATCLQSMLKKEMHTQRRYATCPQGMSRKEEEEEKKTADIHEKLRREIVHKKEFTHHPPKKKIYIYHHTLAHLDQGL